MTHDESMVDLVKQTLIKPSYDCHTKGLHISGHGFYLTLKTMGCLRLVYHGGGGFHPPPQDLSPYGTYGHEILHACSIWPIFLEYNIKVKFYCLKLPELNGLNLA